MQYYNLIHLGFFGFLSVMENCLANARLLSKSLEATGWYTCVSDIHRPISPAPKSSGAGSDIAAGASEVASKVKDSVSGKTKAGDTDETSASYHAGLPVVSFRFSDEFKREFPHIKQETVSLLLRARQWILPNYALPPHEDGTEILRVVIRESMSFDLLDRLVTDIVQVTESLMERDEVDLSVLQAQRRGPVKKEDHQRKKKGRGVKAAVKEEGKDVGKRMADGIHRAVC